MKTCYAGGKQLSILMTAALCFLAISAVPALAQRTSRSTGMERRSEEMNRRRDQLEREMLLRGVEPKSKDAEQQPAPATVSQVRQDFERIQAIYNEFVRVMASKKPLDYEYVSDATAEIKKCSSRLKSNLALPSADDKGKSRKPQENVGDEQIEAALLLLTTRIRSFVTNPLFESSGALDIKLSAMASHDLEKIIELSDRIRKRAGTLNKPGN